MNVKEEYMRCIHVLNCIDAKRKVALKPRGNLEEQQASRQNF